MPINKMRTYQTKKNTETRLNNGENAVALRLAWHHLNLWSLSLYFVTRCGLYLVYCRILVWLLSIHAHIFINTTMNEWYCNKKKDKKMVLMVAKRIVSSRLPAISICVDLFFNSIIMSTPNPILYCWTQLYLYMNIYSTLKMLSYSNTMYSQLIKYFFYLFITHFLFLCVCAGG